jgi:hypothetical protein
MSRVISKAFILIAIASLLVRCDNYEFPKSPYPRIETLPVVNISETGVTFQANVTQKGNLPIINHGFVWGTEENLSISSEDKVQLGPTSNLVNFEANVKSGLYKGESYFVKAFVATDNYFVYGEAVSFKSNGSTPPIITNFSPNEGTLGDTIILKGKFFSARTASNDVKFGTINSKVVTSNDSIIVCIVPNSIPNIAPIFVTVAGNNVQSKDNFIVAYPLINDFNPKVGTFEDFVTITGTNFSSINENNAVKFNEYNAEITAVSKTQIKVKVPTSIISKENSISVTINNQTNTSGIKFTVLPPSINSISSNQGFTGNTIQIKGNNFCPVISGNKVLFEERIATIISSSRTLITAIVPTGSYKNRTFEIEVNAAEQSASSEGFTLQDAWIRKADLPLGNLPEYGPRRYAGTAFAINDMGYAGLGFDAIDNTFFRYDLTENKWSTIASYPGGTRGYAASFVIDGKGYVGMGTSGNDVKSDFWKYDPQTDAWEIVAPIPVSSGYAAYGFSRNGKGYVVAGGDFWEYDPINNAWTRKEDIPITPWYTSDCGFVIDERVYITLVDQYGAPNRLMEFDFMHNTWIQRTSIPNSVYYGGGAKGFSLNGYGYLKWEDYSGNYLYKYDPNTDSWQEFQFTEHIGSRYPIEFVIGNKAYYGTGNGTGVDIWEYDPYYQK